MSITTTFQFLLCGVLLAASSTHAEGTNGALPTVAMNTLATDSVGTKHKHAADPVLLGGGESAGMSAALLFKATGRYCGHNWNVDLQNQVATTDHAACRQACEDDLTCVAASVAAHSGCVKCTKDSVDWASGELHTNSQWTTYTKAPLPCVSPKDYGIAWRNTEDWCVANQGATPTSLANQGSMETTQVDIDSGQIAGRTWFEKAMVRAGVQRVNVAGDSNCWVCGCKASSFSLIHPATSDACNHMFGYGGYCPHNSPFESGSIITGCWHTYWQTNCYTSPQLTAYLS